MLTANIYDVHFNFSYLDSWPQIFKPKRTFEGALLQYCIHIIISSSLLRFVVYWLKVNIFFNKRWGQISHIDQINENPPNFFPCFICTVTKEGPGGKVQLDFGQLKLIFGYWCVVVGYDAPHRPRKKFWCCNQILNSGYKMLYITDILSSSRPSVKDCSLSIAIFG